MDNSFVITKMADESCFVDTQENNILMKGNNLDYNLATKVPFITIPSEAIQEEDNHSTLKDTDYTQPDSNDDQESPYFKIPSQEQNQLNKMKQQPFLSTVSRQRLEKLLRSDRYSDITSVKEWPNNLILKAFHKEINKSVMLNIQKGVREEYEFIKDEYEKVRAIDSQYIIDVHKTFYYEELFVYVIVMEHYEKSLQDEIDEFRRNNSWFSKLQLFPLFFQLTFAITQLASFNISHNNINPSNIFKLKQGTYKLGGIGAYTQLTKQTILLPQNQINLKYFSPELIESVSKNHIEFSNKSDVYSVSAVILDIFTQIQSTQKQNSVIPQSNSITLKSNSYHPQSHNNNSIVRDIQSKSKKIHPLSINKLFKQNNNNNLQLNNNLSLSNNPPHQNINLSQQNYNLSQENNNPSQKDDNYQSQQNKVQPKQNMNQQQFNEIQNHFKRKLLNQNKEKRVFSYEIIPSLIKYFQPSFQSYKELISLINQFIASPIFDDDKQNVVFVMKSKLRMSELKLDIIKNNKDREQTRLTIAKTHAQNGKLHSHYGIFKKALADFLSAVEIYQQISAGNSEDIVDLLRSTAQVYQKMGDYDKYHQYSLKSLDIAEQVYSGNHNSKMNCLNGVSWSYYFLKQGEKALDYAQKALKMQNELSNNQFNDSFTYSLDTVGAAYQLLGNYQEALKYFLESLNYLTSSFQGNRPDIAAQFNNIGVVYEEMKNYEQSFSYFNQASQMYSKLYGDCHPLVLLSKKNTLKSMQNMNKGQANEQLDIQQLEKYIENIESQIKISNI